MGIRTDKATERAVLAPGLSDGLPITDIGKYVEFSVAIARTMA